MSDFEMSIRQSVMSLEQSYKIEKLSKTFYCGGKGSVFTVTWLNSSMFLLKRGDISIESDWSEMFLRVIISMEELNNTPVLLLRSQNRSFKTRQKNLNKRVRNKNQLRQEIYSNHNIFHSSIDLYRNKTAQNLIWDKNYTFKCLINQAKDENSSLKARIWNLEKENRRMERQIETWNLSQGSTKKPYVDMATVDTVLNDQDYHIVSMKMEIHELEKQFQSRQEEFSRIAQQNSQSSELCRMLNHEIALRKVDIYQCMGGSQDLLQRESKDKLSRTLMKQNQQLEMIACNLELKKKTKIAIQGEIAALSNECAEKREVTLPEIERLYAETRKMKAQEDGGLGLERQRLELAQKANKEFQCFMQNKMDTFIEGKMPLQAEIQRLRWDIQQWQAERKLSE